MPIYDFECTCCPSRFELKRGFHDEKPVSCPSCGGKARRIFTSVPIIFKGSGFYVTDSRGGQSFTSSAGSAEESKAGTGEPKAGAAEPKAGVTESKASTAEPKPVKSEAVSGKKAEAKVASGKDKD